MTTIPTKTNVTVEERDILDRLAAVWNAYMRLPGIELDVHEFQHAIHNAQHLIALRVARRVDPELWKQPEVTKEAACMREAYSGGGSPSPRECKRSESDRARTRNRYRW